MYNPPYTQPYTHTYLYTHLHRHSHTYTPTHTGSFKTPHLAVMAQSLLIRNRGNLVDRERGAVRKDVLHAHILDHINALAAQHGRCCM